MILGFGSTETNFEKEIGQEIEEYVKFKFAGDVLECYTDEFKEEMRGWVKGLSTKSKEQAAIYDKAESFPNRYSYFHAYVVGDCNYLCFIVSFSHINRRYPLSPDGWALLQTQQTFTVSLN